MHEKGLIGMYPDGIGFGNISIRCNENTFLISGTATGGIIDLDNSHYALVTDYNLTTNSLTCKGSINASSESLTHALIYESSPSTNAVIHIHNLALWKKLMHEVPTMGATKRQVYTRIIIPAILPQLLIVLRLNLFGAWMVVLVAESTGVGFGLGQVIMMARNTFNPSLVFFTIALIGLLGFLSDWILRMVQKRILYWVPENGGVLRGL